MNLTKKTAYDILFHFLLVNSESLQRSTSGAIKKSHLTTIHLNHLRQGKITETNLLNLGRYGVERELEKNLSGASEEGVDYSMQRSYFVI